MDSAVFVEQKVLDISASTTAAAPNSELDDETITASEDWPDLIG
jgi:hypothetical protein